MSTSIWVATANDPIAWGYFLNIRYQQRILQVVEDLLTTQQVAERLGVKASRVRQLVSAGKLLPLRLSPKVHLFDPDVIKAYEEEPKPQRGRPKKD